MERKASLEMTAADHKACGSTVPAELAANPGKSLADTMSDADIHAFMSKEIAAVRQAHAEALAGDTVMLKHVAKWRDEYLAPNIRYLIRIGRLPEEYKSMDVQKDFALHKCHT